MAALDDEIDKLRDQIKKLNDEKQNKIRVRREENKDAASTQKNKDTKELTFKEVLELKKKE